MLGLTSDEERAFFPHVFAHIQDRLQVVNAFEKCRSFFLKDFFAVFKFVELDFETLTEGTNPCVTD